MFGDSEKTMECGGRSQAQPSTEAMGKASTQRLCRRAWRGHLGVGSGTAWNSEACPHTPAPGPASKVLLMSLCHLSFSWRN